MEPLEPSNSYPHERDEPKRLSPKGRSLSYESSLIERSMKEQSRKKNETSSPVLTRRSSLRKFRPSKMREIETYRTQLTEEFDKIFNQHGHYSSIYKGEREKNRTRWIKNLIDLRAAYSPIAEELDLKIARLARLSLLKRYLEEITVSKSTLEKMIQILFIETIYHHRSVHSSVNRFLRAMDFLPAEAAELLQKEIILYSPPADLAEYLFRRLEEISKQPHREKESKNRLIQDFADHLRNNKNKTDFFSLIIENDIQLQLSEFPTEERAKELIFRAAWYPSIAILQAYERKWLPATINQLLDSFRKEYTDRRGLLDRMLESNNGNQKLNQKDSLEAFQACLEKFCNKPLPPELSELLTLFRKKLDACFGRENKKYSLGLLTQIFVLRFIGNAIQAKLSFFKKNPDIVRLDLASRLMLELNKKMLEYLQLEIDPTESKQVAAGKFKKKFLHFMDRNTRSVI